MRPSITVFTSCYNQAEFLPEAIESVLSQTYSDFEYHLFDDGSTDDSFDIMQRYANEDGRIVLRPLDKQQNVAHVIDMSVEAMRGQVWLWCPSDDVWLPELLQKKVDYSMNLPKNAVIYSDWVVIDASGKPFRTITPRIHPEAFSDVVWQDSPIGFTGIWIPVKVFELVGKFPRHLDFSEDFYWMIKATIHGIPFHGLPEVLYKKRVHSGQTSALRREEIARKVKIIRKELKIYRDSIGDSE